jgi:hypothetical protein
MSAFIVEDETINTVVNFLYIKESGNDAYWPRYIMREAGHDFTDLMTRKVFAQAMMDLNVRAVNGRYEESHAAIDTVLITYRTSPDTTIIQAYKSLKCWLYQCSEDATIDSDLYKLMDNVAKEIAMYIVEISPAYNAAEWG